MSKEFNPAPHDKHPKKAVEADKKQTKPSAGASHAGFGNSWTDISRSSV